MSSSITALRALSTLISSGIENLENAYAAEGSSFPSLDAPYTPSPLEQDPKVEETTKQVVAAAFQLIATVNTPLDTLMTMYAPAMYTSATLQFAIENSVVDALKEGDQEKGMHVEEIARKIKVTDHTKLARVLRYLATRHVFREVTPNVFANNRLSSALAKAKSLEQIQADPMKQYDDAPVASIVGMFCGESLTTSVQFPSFVKHEKTTPCPFQLAHKTDRDLWDWYVQPENILYGSRFATGFKALVSRYSNDTFTSALDWASMKEDSLVVDVGGSVGVVTSILAKEFPHLSYVVQDLPAIIENEAPPFWEERLPAMIANGKVKLQGHSFFNPQPVKNADVYFMRFITHDWPTEKCITIMKHLRDAAKPDTTLIVFDSIIMYTCKDDGPWGFASNAPNVPAPLLHNLGVGIGGFDTMIDLQMMSMMGSQERTVDEFRELGEKTGWKLDSIKPGLVATMVYSAV
jgi:hypothetical protein